MNYDVRFRIPIARYGKRNKRNQIMIVDQSETQIQIIREDRNP
jgi:hypothetical protein